MKNTILKNKLLELESFFPSANEQNSKISAREIGWHIDHTLKVIIKSCTSVKKSNPEEYKWKFNLARFFVFTMGSFPRGRSKAPKAVVTEGDIAEQTLRTQIDEAKLLIDDLLYLPKMSNFNHPYFGVIHLSQVVLFLEIHTEHHLKIMREIKTFSTK